MRQKKSVKSLRKGSLLGNLSLGIKLSIAITVLISLLMTAVGYAAYMRDRNALQQEAVSRGWSIVNSVKAFAVDDLRNKNYSSLNWLISNYARDSFFAGVTILDEQGKIISHTDPSLKGMVLEDPLIKKVLTQKKELMDIVKSANGSRVINYVTPISDQGGQVYGYFNLKVDLTYIDEHLQKTMRNIIINALLAVIAGLILTRLIILRFVQRPITELVAATQQVATGDFSVRLNVINLDEIGKLAYAFNTMTGQLGLMFQSLRATVTDMSHTAQGIVHRLEQPSSIKEVIYGVSPDSETGNSRQSCGTGEIKDIKGAAKRLVRMAEKLNTLAMQFKTGGTVN